LRKQRTTRRENSRSEQTREEATP